MRTKVFIAVAAVALAMVGIGFVPPADAGGPPNTFTVEKVVVGTAPPGSVFEVEVSCHSNDSAPEGGTATVRFDENGNPLDANTFPVGLFQECTANETVTNGATVTYSCAVSQTTGSSTEGEQVSCVDDQTVA